MSQIVPEQAYLRRELSQQRRHRWATPIATLSLVVHGLATVAVMGWYYFIVPRWKWRLESLNVNLPETTVLVIKLSDTIVNYWYLVVAPLLLFAIVDWFATRWIAQRLGVRCA